MPYADPIKQREAAARSYLRKYQQDTEFRRRETARKALWKISTGGRRKHAASTRKLRANNRECYNAFQRVYRRLSDQGHKCPTFKAFMASRGESSSGKRLGSEVVRFFQLFAGANAISQTQKPSCN